MKILLNAFQSKRFYETFSFIFNRNQLPYQPIPDSDEGGEDSATEEADQSNITHVET